MLSFFCALPCSGPSPHPYSSVPLHKAPSSGHPTEFLSLAFSTLLSFLSILKEVGELTPLPFLPCPSLWGDPNQNPDEGSGKRWGARTQRKVDTSNNQVIKSQALSQPSCHLRSLFFPLCAHLLCALCNGQVSTSPRFLACACAWVFLPDQFSSVSLQNDPGWSLSPSPSRLLLR